MAEKKRAKAGARKSAKSPAPTKPRKGSAGFTDEERAAMRESKEARGQKKEGTVLAKSPGCRSDRAMGERVHASTRALVETWYGMPAHAKDG
jgi:hypothetical protein